MIWNSFLPHMTRGGQKENSFDSIFGSASFNVTPKRFTTVVRAFESLLIIEWVSLL